VRMHHSSPLPSPETPARERMDCIAPASNSHTASPCPCPCPCPICTRARAGARGRMDCIAPASFTHTARHTPLWPEHGPASSAANYHRRKPEPALGVSPRG
jgi:hypothetical protein